MKLRYRNIPSLQYAVNNASLCNFVIVAIKIVIASTLRSSTIYCNYLTYLNRVSNLEHTPLNTAAVISVIISLINAPRWEFISSWQQIKVWFPLLPVRSFKTANTLFKKGAGLAGQMPDLCRLKFARDSRDRDYLRPEGCANIPQTVCFH